MWINIQLSTFLLVLATLCLEQYVDGRGARFGGVRSSFRSGYRSSYRSGYRSSYRSGYRATRSYRGYRSTRYGKYAAAFAAGYMVYGFSRYRTRYYGTPYWRDDPDVCNNLERYATYDNGTVSRTQKLDYFVCPYENDDPDDAMYCCGPEFKQKCCTYWNSDAKTGAIVGIVFAVIVAIVVIVVVIKCCCTGKKTRRPPPSAHYTTTTPTLLTQNGAPDHYDVNKTDQSGQYPNPAAAQPYSGYPAQPYPAQPYPAQPYPAQPYPPQPDVDSKAIGFESAPPPSYESANGYPTK